MISSRVLIFLSSILAICDAYPNIAEHLAREARGRRSDSLYSKLKKRVAFDTKAQLVDVKGDHAFQAPGSQDQRGPCPGLNALANHNYLPHSGVATIPQFIEATTSVFGMGVDLATVLSTYGAVMDGDLTSWSIGGPTNLVGGLLGSLGGRPQGISGSHNKYETDGSPTRGDLYQHGNDYLVQLKQFQQLYDAGKAEDSYDIPLLTDFRYSRFQQSIKENPYFLVAPFSGVVVQPAAYTFIYRYMGNKSAENPEGLLTGDVLKSFFAITGEDGNFIYTPGHERIPSNWYTRNKLDPYGILQLSTDTNIMALQHPEFLVPGGNTGTTNSFVGLDFENLTGGLYTLDNLAKNNNALCLGLELTVQFLPDTLRGLVSDVMGALNKLVPSLQTATDTLGCPQLQDLDDAQFQADMDKFPGASKLRADGTYPG